MGSRQPGPVGSPRTRRVTAIPGPGTQILYAEFATQPDPRYTQNIQRRWPPRTRSDPHPSSTCREDTCESAGTHRHTHTSDTPIPAHNRTQTLLGTYGIQRSAVPAEPLFPSASPSPPNVSISRWLCLVPGAWLRFPLTVTMLQLTPLDCCGWL